MTKTDTRVRAKRPGGWAANLLLVLVSVAVTLVVAELALRLLIKPRAVMTRQLLADLGVTDADQAWERHPDLGWMIKPNATFRHTSPFGEFDTEIRTDALGIRVPPDRQGRGRQSGRGILFIGDSITAGYEVEYDKTFAAVVEAALNGAGQGVRALNAGIRGYSAEQSYRRMLDLLARSELDITDVVYQFVPNDPFENMSLHFPKRLMSKPGAYLDGAGEIRFRALDFPVGVFDSEAHFVEPGGGIGVLPVVGRRSTPRWVLSRTLRHREARDIFDQVYLVGLVRLAIEMYATPADVAAVRDRYPYLRPDYVADTYGGYFPGNIDVSWEAGSYPLRLLEAIIRQMQAAADRHGARFWVSLPLALSSEARAFFGELAAKHGIAVIDPGADGTAQRWLARCGSTLIFKIDGHYAPCGHAGQAEPIAKALAATAR